MSILHTLLVPFIALAGLLTTTPYLHMVEQVQSSVVRITGTHQREGDTASYVCSGEVIGPNRVLTAAHCVGQNVRGDGILVEVVKADPTYDLALLAVDTRKPHLPMRGKPVTRYEPLTALGYAWGIDRISAFPVKAFLVDSTPAPTMTPGLLVVPGYVGGMSGGPVVDATGMMVGIVQQSNDGVGYGVGVLIIRAFLLGETV